MTNHLTAKPSSSAETSAALPTFMDHIRELQGRLFIIAVAFVLACGAAYPFFDKISNILLAPLGKDHELVYLTPGGAFSFIIKVCLYVGVVAVLPLIVYHLYRFAMPAVKPVRLRIVLLYTTASLLLAVAGVLFAYFVSLPAALYFLTGFDLYHINPMLTIDSYFSFVMTYLAAGALLFQIPLVMMVIDSATPLKPSRLMAYQRHIIVGSFIIAAIISPTPDALNQTILASPMVGMYQVGVVAIWSSGRKRTKKTARSVDVRAGEPSKKHLTLESHLAAHLELPDAAMLDPRISNAVKASATAPTPTRKKTSQSGSVMPVSALLTPSRTAGSPKAMDVMSPRSRSMRVAPAPPRKVVYRRDMQTDQTHRQPGTRRSLDGMVTARY